MFWWYLVIALVVIIFFVWLIWFRFFSKGHDNHEKKSSSTSLASINEFKGQYGESYIKEKLRQSLDENQITYHLYNDLYLPNHCQQYSKISQIDHLLITPKNIYVIEDKWYSLNFNNQLCGNLNESQLYLYNPDTNSQKPVPNPFKQNHNHMLTVINFFSSIEIETSNLKNIVIMKTNSYNKTNINNPLTAIYHFYTIDSFLDEILKIETVPLTSQEIIENNFNEEMFAFLDDVVLQKEYFKKEHQNLNDY